MEHMGVAMLLELHVWWWVMALINLTIIAFLKDTRPSLYMMGATTALLFTTQHSLMGLLTVSLSAYLCSYLCIRTLGLTSLGRTTIGWLLMGICAQGFPLLLVSLSLYYFLSTIVVLIRLRHIYFQADQHTIQVLTLLLTFSMSVYAGVPFV